MSITSNPTPKKASSPTRQSDIVIAPDGTVHISFLWEDLRDLAGLEPAPEDAPRPASWIPPQANLSATEIDEYASCRLCPKDCGFPRLENAHPTCGDHRLRVSTYGVSLGDEPEIRGTRGSGAIMLSGCPLTCPSCHNPEKVAHGEKTTLPEFFAICMELLEHGAHNIQILSPTVHLPVLRAALRALKDSAFPLPVVFKSSGYESVAELRKLEGLVDIYLPDFKFGGCSSWAERAGVANYFEVAQDAVREMIRQVGALQCDANGTAWRGVLVRHVESPLPAREKEELKRFLNSLPEGIGISYAAGFVTLE